MAGNELDTKSAPVFETSEEFALRLDYEDELKNFRGEFLFPRNESGTEYLYFAGNSLGLQPKTARRYVEMELEDWASLGVEGHFEARRPWLPYHENLTDMTARLVGALPSEVVVMNTLTVNLHLMMVSFYRPTKSRFKIIIEEGAFPSDKYAVDSQASFHGFDPRSAVIELKPRVGEDTLRTEDIVATIEQHGDSVALVMLGQVNYRTGQAFDMSSITAAAHKVGAYAGFNLAHGAGNLLLSLHDWKVDFAVWCSYKYLNSGPGALAGCFIHEQHHQETLPRFAGWWGHDKGSRFEMGPNFKPIPGAEGWQLSNPPIFQLAALVASMELFDQATMKVVREKSEKLTGYLEFMLQHFCGDVATVVTPSNPAERGCQLSVRFAGNPREMLRVLKLEGALCDFREPDIVRIAPAPLYTGFYDVYRLVRLIEMNAGNR